MGCGMWACCPSVRGTGWTPQYRAGGFGQALGTHKWYHKVDIRPGFIESLLCCSLIFSSARKQQFCLQKNLER